MCGRRGQQFVEQIERVAAHGPDIFMMHDGPENNACVPARNLPVPSRRYPVDGSGFFGTESEREDSHSVKLLEAKAKAFRYCISVHRMFFEEDGEAFDLLGVADGIPGTAFAVSLGGFAENHDAATVERYLRSTFMHEFGHALGLGHGGSDDINYKPNHVSGDELQL